MAAFRIKHRQSVKNLNPPMPKILLIGDEWIRAIDPFYYPLEYGSSKK